MPEESIRPAERKKSMKIVVLAGGISTERDVSLTSGKMIYKAVKERGHQVILGYDKTLPEPLSELFEREEDWDGQIGAIGEKNPDIEQIKALRPDWKTNFFGPNVITLCQQADVVFMGLHGENGENGKIQAYFDLMGITYTGTDYVSSALAMDKSLAKELFAAHHIPTPEGITLRKGETESHRVPFPCIVKSCKGGSSVGVVIAENEKEYAAAKEEAFRYDDQIVVEQYIKGREFSICVMEGKALPVIEIAPLHGFYDYKNKYQAGSTIETCPAELSPEKTEEMQRIAEKVFDALRLKCYARMDFMMDEKEQIYCLEANTLPGMTPTSLIPQEAAALGIGFGELCEKIIQMAADQDRA